MFMKTILVSQHPELSQYLQEQGLLRDEFEHIEFINDPAQIRGKRVICSYLPPHLAVEAAEVTIVPINVPPELRGQKLSLEQIRAHAGEIKSYTLSTVSERSDLEKLIVTRHQGLVEYFKKEGLVDGATAVVAHVGNPDELKGKHVFGVLPIHLAAAAERVTHVPLNLPREVMAERRELSLEEMRPYIGERMTYQVHELDRTFGLSEVAEAELEADHDIELDLNRSSLS